MEVEVELWELFLSPYVIDIFVVYADVIAAVNTDVAGMLIAMKIFRGPVHCPILM